MTIKAVLLTIVLATALSCAPRDRYLAFNGYAQGGTYTVKYNSRGVDAQPQEISAHVDAILKAIDSSVSGYNKASALSRFNGGERITPDRIFSELYSLSMMHYRASEGAFDVAAGPLFDIWGFGFKNDSLPSDETVAKVLATCGTKTLKPVFPLDPLLSEDGTLCAEDIVAEGFEGVRPELNFNAIAQGYSCDLVARYLMALGVKDFLVDIGEIVCQGVNPAGLPWTIGIDRPEDGNNTPGKNLQDVFQCPGTHCGLVTSGNYRKFYVRDGKKYSHTIDPRTGYPVSHNLLSATICAPDGAEADAVATRCMVIGLEPSKELISSSKQLEGYLVYEENGEMKSWASEGFKITSR